MSAGLINLGRKIKTATGKYLENPSDIEYLVVSIYRINYRNVNRKNLMKNIIAHLANPDALVTDVKLVGRFSTIFNNRILGLEVQNASIYGSKIELAFDDFDRELANTIRKHDIIVVHRLNKKSFKMIDAIASMVGLSTHSPSGIKEPSSYLSQSIKDKIPNPTTKLANTLADKFLVGEKPIFSGIITMPQSVAGNNIKLTIEAQDMIRIMQHINTEESSSSEIKGLPKDLDKFFKELDASRGINVKGEDHLNILHSAILKTLGSAVFEEITSFTDAEEALKKGIKFIGAPLSTLQSDQQIKNFNDRIFIRGISNSLFMVHISPIKALKLFVKYYAKNTGINTFFDFDLWDTSFWDDKATVETIYRNIFKDMAGINPYFTFGMMLDFKNERNIIPYTTDKLTGRNTIFALFGSHPLKHVFSQKTFDNIFKNRVNEGILLKFLNDDKDDDFKTLLARFFINLVNPTEVDLEEKTGNLIYGRNNATYPLFLKNNNEDKESFIISKWARQKFNENLDIMKADFSDSISLDYIVSTNYSSVRSTEYNPVLTNQMKSIPITQIVQLFIGALTSIPVSQSKETTGFDNTAYNISQRIWLTSAIGFKHPTTGLQSWIYKKGMKPVIYFGLNYKPAISHTARGSSPTGRLLPSERNLLKQNITYISDKDTINSKMFTLPSVGSLSIYEWGTENIHIGYSKFNEDDFKSLSNIPQLSLGGSMVFDLENINGNINNYVSENTEKQIGGQRNVVPKFFPRIALFELRDTSVGDAMASNQLRLYDEFKQISDADLGSSNYWIYLGYDMYAMNGRPDTIPLDDASKVRLYAPFVDITATLGDLGTSIFDAMEGTPKPFWDKEKGKDFPDDGKAKRGTGNNRSIITGIKDYYDPTKFLPILKAFQHYIKFGFTGVNGSGDKDLYKLKTRFQMYHNIQTRGYYVETFRLRDKDLRTNSISEIVESLITYLDQFHGNDEKKRLMMVKFARRVSIIEPIGMNGNEAPFRTVDEKFEFHPPSLMDAIKSHEIKDSKAMKTMNIILSFIRSISHYMNRVAKESTTGGVLYSPLKNRADGTIFEIGDAISFKSNEEATGLVAGIINLVKSLAITVNKPQTNLDIYKKTYYVWKVTYYFGGAGTDPSGSSGSTMRIYLTDSGIHWQSSYEEKDITTRIAESMQLNRLAVKL